MIKFCVPLYKEIFAHLNPDYFIYNWDETEGKYTGTLDNCTPINKEEIIQIYNNILGDNIKGIEIQTNSIIKKYQKTLSDLRDCVTEDTGRSLQNESYFHHCLNYISQHHCSDLCNKLRKKTTNIQYDCIIKIRTDIVFKQLYKNNNGIQQLINQKDKFFEYLNQFKDVPLLFFRKLQFKENWLKADDTFYIGNDKGINVLLQNICSTWILNILQHSLSDLTLYKTNHPIFPVDQHNTLFSNIIFNQIAHKDKTELRDMTDHCYTNIINNRELCRYNVSDTDTYDEIKIKNKTYMTFAENKNIAQKVRL